MESFEVFTLIIEGKFEMISICSVLHSTVLLKYLNFLFIEAPPSTLIIPLSLTAIDFKSIYENYFSELINDYYSDGLLSEISSTT